MSNEFVARNGLIALDNSTITGSLNVTNGITGSLLGTASFATTASFALNAGGASAASNLIFSGSVTASVDVGTTTFRLISGSSTFLFVSSSGNVGIGTTTPVYKLDVNTVGGTSAIRVNADTNQISQVRLEEANTVRFAISYLPSDDSTRFYHISSDLITLNANSNIGIGTTAPAAKLQVSGTVNVANIRGSGSLTTSSIFTVDGAAGRLFSVNDSLSGSLFSVNTIAGLPVVEAFSDNTVRIGQYGQRALFVSQSSVGVGKETALNADIDVSGSAVITGSLNVTGSITSTGTITATTLVVQVITSSTDFVTGSTRFGSLVSNTHIFTGSVSISGSLTSNGPISISGSLTSNGDTIITGSLTVFSGSNVDFQVTDTGTKIGATLSDNHIITGSVSATGSITGTSIIKSGGTSTQSLMADGSVKANPTGSVVATSQTTTSATYVDLTTAGPTATVTIGASGAAIVILTAQAMTATSGVEAYMGFAVSGATTVAASDAQAMVSSTRNTGDTPKQSAVFWVTGLTAGSNTFTSKYRSGTAGTVATFVDRNIIVIPI